MTKKKTPVGDAAIQLTAPFEIIAAAVKIGRWAEEHNIKTWKIGPCQSRIDDAPAGELTDWQIGNAYLRHAEGIEHATGRQLAFARAVIAADRALRPAGDAAMPVVAWSIAEPAKWTEKEIADGCKGIRWVTAEGVFGCPTADDMRAYFAGLGEAPQPDLPVSDPVTWEEAGAALAIATSCGDIIGTKEMQRALERFVACRAKGAAR